MRHFRDVSQGNKAVCGARLARHSGHVPAYDRADVECLECRTFMLRESMAVFRPPRRTTSDILDAIMERIPETLRRAHFEYVNVIARLLANEIKVTEEAVEKALKALSQDSPLSAKRFVFETE